MFGLFKGKDKKQNAIASHMATLMNLKMIEQKESISGGYGDSIKNDPFILGWAYGLSIVGSRLNGWSGSDSGALLMKIYVALYGSRSYAVLATKLAVNKDEVFLDGMNTAVKEYHPIHQELERGGNQPVIDYFPSLVEYLETRQLRF